MEYPFKFNELLLTSMVLDTLGFTPYNSGCENFGARSLKLGESWYQLIEQDEMIESDYTGMYDTPCYYVSGTYHSSEKYNGTIYFIHELYESIKEVKSDEEVKLFIELTKKKGVNMWYYLESYLNYKNNI